jgi:hypothetical protein
MFSDRAKLIALAIVHVFETSKPFGDYSAVAVLNDGAGISYGINQFTHKSGSLAAVIERYIELAQYNENQTDLAYLVNFLPSLRQKVRIDELSKNTVLKSTLRDLGSDPFMRQAQNEIAFERYLRPAIAACEGSHFTQPLSLAVIYDSINHGSWEKIRDRVVIDRTGYPSNEAFERAWITEYVHDRDAWLASVPRLNSTRYRTRLFLNLIERGNWQITLPLRVQGVTLTDAMFSSNSAAAPVVQPTGRSDDSVADTKPVYSPQTSAEIGPTPSTSMSETNTNIDVRTKEQPKGQPATAPATTVTTNNTLANWITGGSITTGVGGLVWGYISGHIDGFAVIAICVTVLILAFKFSETIKQVVSIQTHADPDKYNVK